MAFRYPNGKKYVNNTQNTPKKRSQNISYSNRGMSLEKDLNETNEYYRSRGVAVIHKKPTPLQIVDVDYPRRSAAVVTEAYFKKPSTTDYNGVYRGYHIDFEAKETKNKQSFPLKNFHEHQIEHMQRVLQQGGIAFAILRFTAVDETYFLSAEHLCSFYMHRQNERKSIPKSEIEEKGHLIPVGLHPRINYLKILDQIISNE
ncbi:Holliday junction resolvase RecU [Texcoconibacillus texcoconensis]|uniref:Holliday junction resolvase RecU n=1 Tax=Texcoconibacillus texcoconensis TaxID=1095777 RepID=A0A840QQ85_9BACI|nr:recombination protein U [Texcoconibacillus texcoconensis]